jgi:hypothetical protein
VFYFWDMVADPPPLGGLVPAEPEELLTRGALGAPGRLRIEVGLSEPRFARPEGRRTSKEEMALLRALGGVSYPADRERLLAEAGRWLGGHEAIRQRLSDLPDLVYGGELEVLRRLQEPVSEEPASSDQEGGEEPGSAGVGNQDGSEASR